MTLGWVLAMAACLQASAWRVAVVGDAGERTPTQQTVFDQVVASRPDAVLVLGDNFYEDGLHSESQIRDVWGPLLSLRLFGVLGNHDQRGHAQPFLMPSRYYRAEIGTGVELIALDTSPLLFPTQGLWNPRGIDPSPQWAWLDAMMQRPKPRWRIVIGHHPVHSATKHCSEQRRPKQRLAAALRRGNVDLYLAGHTHCLEECVANGTAFAVVGSSARLNSIRTECPWEHSCKATHEHGWLMLDLGPDLMVREWKRIP